MVKVVKAFKGCRDGSSRVTKFKPGDEIEGDIARVAVEQGWAEEAGNKAASAKSKVAEGGEADGADDEASGKKGASSGGKAGKGAKGGK